MAGKSAYRHDIDGLRTVAVMAVVLFHFGIDRLAGGFVGVDVFFVISGFLITRILIEDVTAGNFSFSNFYLRRARRLFPALFVTIAVTYVIAFAIYPPALFRETSESVFYAILSLSNIYFWSQAGYFDTEAISKPLLHTWSLGVEEQFYLFWPLLIFLLFRGGIRKIAIAVLALVALISFATNLPIEGGALRQSLPGDLQFDAEDAFFLSPFRIWQFALGGAAVWLVARWRLPRLAEEAALILGLALIVGCVLLYDKNTVFPSWAAVVPSVAAVLAIWAGRAPLTGMLLSNPLSVWIGKISYSLYLVHWPVVVFYIHLTDRELSALEITALFGVMLVLSALLYYLIETRFRKRRSDSLAQGRAADLGFGLVCALMAIIMLLPVVQSWTGNGWPWRISNPAVASQVDFSKPFAVAHYGGRSCEPPFCEWRPERDKKLILVGDSHMRHYFEGFRDHFTDYHVMLFTAPACAIFSPEYMAAQRVKFLECQEAQTLAMNAIAKGDAAVIISNNWEGNRLDAGVARRSDGSGQRSFGSPDDLAAFMATETARVAELAKGKRMIVLGNNPTFRAAQSPESCIFEPFGREASCEPTWIAGQPKLRIRARINKAMRAAMNDTVGFLDPYDYLCENGRCANLDDQFPIYSDTTHFSDRGSILMVAAMERDLRGLLEGKAARPTAPEQTSVASQERIVIAPLENAAEARKSFRVRSFIGGVSQLRLTELTSRMASGEQLSFIGTRAFSGKPGEIRVQQRATANVLRIDLDGDKKGDIKITLDNFTGEIGALDLIL